MFKPKEDNQSDGKTLDDKYFMAGKAASATATPMVSQIISKPINENTSARDHDIFLNKAMEDQLKQQEKLKQKFTFVNKPTAPKNAKIDLSKNQVFEMSNLNSKVESTMPAGASVLPNLQ